jgi:hypothetical protein
MGRTWKILAISNIAAVESDQVTLDIHDESESHSVYYRQTNFGATPQGAVAYSTAIGAPELMDAYQYIETLPELRLPAGTVITLSHSGQDPDPATFLIED